METCLSLFKTMSSDRFKVKPNSVTCSCMFDILVRAERVDEALTVVRMVEEEGMGGVTEFMYSSLLKLAGAGGSSTRIYAELIDMVGSGEREEGKEGKEADWKRSGSDDNDDGDDDDDENLMRAFMLFRECKRPDIALYNTLLAQCAQRGDLCRSLELLAKIRRDEEGAGLKPTIYTYASLMKCCAVRGRRDEAEKVLEECRAEGIVPDERMMREWRKVARS